MSFSRLPQNSIAISVSQLLSPYSPTNTMLLIGHIEGNVAPTPEPGYVGPSIELYEPFLLQQIQDPQLMMSYLRQLGLNAVFGVTQTIDLPAPTTVTVNADTSVTLTWATRPSNYGDLPTTGTGTVTQATSGATGTYGGIVTSSYSIVVTGVTGTFDTTHTISVVLSNPSASVIDATQSDEIACMVYNSLVESLYDNTNNTGVQTPTIYIACLPANQAGFGPSDGDVFDFVLSQQVYYNSIVMPYEIVNQNDIDVDYARFFQAIEELNEPTQVQNGFYGTIGVWATISVDRNSQADLVTYDSPYFLGCSYPYDSSANIVTQLAGQVASAAATVIFSNPVPYDPLDKIVLDSLIPPDSVNEGLTWALSAETLDKGYTPIYVNTNNQAAFVRTIVSMLTYPNTELPATQYFDVQDWQTIFYNRGAKNAALQAPQFTNVKLSNSILTKIRNAMIDVDKQFEQMGMFENVNALIPQYSVTVNPDNTSQAIISTPVEVIPGFQSSSTTIYLQNTFGTFTATGFVTGGN